MVRYSAVQYQKFSSHTIYKNFSVMYSTNNFSSTLDGKVKYTVKVIVLE